ncbi:hypothetical protein IQ273_05255 [Nodosilinea sp. LEGE 07298]|uniref:macro domain-containing protein n=1 Tax=Nodosilinea sp. LEGE 07298 TaxID=2777970 RepID=UPI001880C70D|nr:macro domain-containing protein [Nodosilinea sp. LEGE 07298]MBE9108824.1 hypothetical protein [Nodosilinea sp. LEGE 07298]
MTIGIWRIATTSISIFGFLWLLIEPLGLFIPDAITLGLSGYISLLVSSMLISIFLRFPKKSISRKLSSPNSTIEIKLGDIFQEKGHLVVGFNDVFDTEIGEIIAEPSVQGQFLLKVYKSEKIKLDTDIEEALKTHKERGKEDLSKLKGNQRRYPIGTTISLGNFDRRYFLVAYGSMGNDLKIQSNADCIWHSLSNLWEQVRLKGHGEQISIPVIGSNLARTNLPRVVLVKLIITSFLIGSKEEFIARKLTIVIPPQDLEYVNLYDLEDFLKTAVF